MTYVPYTAEHRAHLMAQDPRMGRVVPHLGEILRPVTPDLFEALCSSVLSQQISGAAAATIEARLVTACGGAITPESLGKLSVGEIQRCGTSFRKAGYLSGAAEAVLSGRLDIHSLPDRPDEEVIEALSSLKGIGRWTAEMLLIFALSRENILSYDDLAIRRGLMRLHGLDAISKAAFEDYRHLYHPYGTAASLVLWAISAKEFDLSLL